MDTINGYEYILRYKRIKLLLKLFDKEIKALSIIDLVSILSYEMKKPPFIESYKD